MFLVSEQKTACQAHQINETTYKCDRIHRAQIDISIGKKNAYALKTPYIVVFLTVILLSQFRRRRSIEIPIEMFFDLMTLACDL